MHFINETIDKNGIPITKLVKVPSITNFVQNIETFKEMWIYLQKYNGVRNLLTRNFNQDPLENFFCKIRNVGVRNINPTCHQFTSAFKTLIINNFSSPHSVSANCENDNNKLLQSVSSILVVTETNPNPTSHYELEPIIDILYNNIEETLHNEAKMYVTGYVLKQCKSKIFKTCKTCISNLITNKDENSYIFERDYTKKSLFYPSQAFCSLLNEIYRVITLCLQKMPEIRFLQDQILNYIDIVCTYDEISCSVHKDLLKKHIKNVAFNIIIHSWCKGVNRLLQGKLSTYDKNDKVKLMAYKYYETHLRKRSKK